MAPWIRLAALRSVWIHTRSPFRGGSKGWELDQRMAHTSAMHWKWHRLERGPKGIALDSVFLYNRWDFI
tara:strand:+ start:291 stop:497 length:207 start_codon:yes stop_codon:yes gene_type:complete